MQQLKYLWKASLVVILLILNLNGNGQSVDSPSKQARNNINAYLGVFDANINYERNIIQRSKSYSSLRAGFGYAMLWTAGEGNYINAAFIHLMGERNSHLEIDLGLKYMVTNSIENPDFSETVIPDIFVGYRYEKPSGGFVLRFGLNYPTVINLGLGFKF